MPLKSALGSIALMPLFAPSLVQALGIVFLFGRNGVINRTFNLAIDIYGFWGIVISDVFYSFPHAYLILSAALAVADARLYESAQVLGATGARIFRDITLPSTKYGILSATFVVFTIVITDFGNPMVIGGDYNVLATEIYNQVSGQGNFSMGAVIGVMLLVPAALAVIAEKWIMRRHHATITERSQPLPIVRSRWRDRVGLAFALRDLRDDRGDRAGRGRGELRDAVAVQHARQPAPLPVRSAERPAAAVDQHLGLADGGGHRRRRHGRRRVRDAKAAQRRRAMRCTSCRSCPRPCPGMVLGLGYILVFNDPAQSAGVPVRHAG